MAVTINLKNVVLYDRWPGHPDPNLGMPTNGFDATSGHSCVTDAQYPPGTKIQVRQDDASRATGPYTMIYLRFAAISTGEAMDLSNGWGFVSHVDYTNNGNAADGLDSSSSWWQCANKANKASCEVSVAFPKAIACNTALVNDADTSVTSGVWGWFWCGGVCPAFDITAFDSGAANVGTEVTTDGNVNKKQEFMWVEDTSQICMGGFTAGETTDTPGGWVFVDDA